MKKILLILLPILGLVGGAGAGYVMHVPNEHQATQDEHIQEFETGQAETQSQLHKEDHVKETSHKYSDVLSEYVEMGNQFIIPIIKGGNVGSLVIIALSIEVIEGEAALVSTHEPKIRDEFLQFLFDYANVGGFDDAYTQSSNLEKMRDDLIGIARNILGDIVVNVLITDILRQDA